jgi:ketosteroid isomerase-like protein
MNKSTATLTLVFAGVVALPLLAAEPTDRSAEADLRATIAELRTASVEGDTQKVVASMTDDYLQTDISGLVQNKDTWLKNYFIPVADLIKAGKFRWESYDLKDVEIRIHGDTGIVVGALEAKGSGARFDVERIRTRPFLANCVLLVSTSGGRASGCWLPCTTQCRSHPRQSRNNQIPAIPFPSAISETSNQSLQPTANWRTTSFSDG